jgi:hypothetical protein
MTQVVVSQTAVSVVVTQAGRPDVQLQVPAAAQVVVRPIGLQGPPGPAGPGSTLTAGAGLSIVGNEIRMAIGILPVAG